MAFLAFFYESSGEEPFFRPTLISWGGAGNGITASSVGPPSGKCPLGLAALSSLISSRSKADLFPQPPPTSQPVRSTAQIGRLAPHST